MQKVDIADLERISGLIYERYNYDFRNYAVSSFRRRVTRILELRKLTVTHLLEQLAATPRFVNEFIAELTVNVTEMYRDPYFWETLRKKIVPAILREKKAIRIWHAGCSSGEEVIAMCILLEELGALDSATIIATDLDELMLQRARRAAFPMKNMALNEQNYHKAGGTAPNLAGYYIAESDHAVFHPDLLRKVSFLHHDLVVGDVFGTFDLILCRNVMIYFNQQLQNEVLKKFHSSMDTGGYLAIGSKESLIWCDYGNRFKAVNSEEKIYMKVKE